MNIWQWKNTLLIPLWVLMVLRSLRVDATLDNWTWSQAGGGGSREGGRGNDRLAARLRARDTVWKG